MIATGVLRMASVSDAEAIRNIYAPYCHEDCPISFELAPPSVEEMASRISSTMPAFPWLVYESEAIVVGYAYGGTHSQRPAYRWCVNASVYISADYHGKGVGRKLYRALFELLRLQGFYNAYAGITLPNAKSEALHASFGFEPVARYPNVGFKGGRWHDVGWYAVKLREHISDPSEPAPLDLLSPEQLERVLHSSL